MSYLSIYHILKFSIFRLFVSFSISLCKDSFRQLHSTTYIKAGFSTLDDLYNLVTKIITKYPVLTTFKILKIIKFYISNFLFLEILTIVRTGYSITVFVTRLYKSSSLLKPAFIYVVQFSKNFSQISKKFFPKISKIFPKIIEM